MANLLAALGSTAGALNAFDQVLQVTQNNVANASTPGYAKESLPLEAMSFDLATGAPGGVRAGQIESARDQYAEQAVRRQNTLLGAAQQNVSSLNALQRLFDISGQTGIPYALNNLLQSFSAWAQSPSDATARKNVMNQAAGVANAFQQTAAGLNSAERDAEQQLQSTVTQINRLAGQLQQENVQIMSGSKRDPGIDAQIHSTLEQLSQYGDVTALQQSDGTMTVLLNGQTPLVVADKQYQIGFQLGEPPSPTYPGRPSAVVTAADGSDITTQTTGGQLGALLNIRNTVLPSYIGGASQVGDLNTLAKQFADTVNGLLTPGGTGVPLFVYDNANDTNVASTLTVSSSASASALTAVDPGPPSVANGVPLALSALSNSTQISGATFSGFFGAMAGRVGSALNDATNQQQMQQSTLAQAQNLRQQVSGVNLDEEATTMIEFQRAYDANSRLLTVLDQITQDAINILQP